MEGNLIKEGMERMWKNWGKREDVEEGTRSKGGGAGGRWTWEVGGGRGGREQ